MTPEFSPADEQEIGDVVDYVTDHLPVESGDALIAYALNLYGEKRLDMLPEVRKRLDALKVEQTVPTDVALKVIIDSSEEVVQQSRPQKDQRREPGFRSNTCGYISNLVCVIGEQLGFQADLFQTMDLNEHRGIPREASFKHAFTVLTDNQGKRFLVDLTFCQFIDPETKGVRYHRVHASDDEAVAFAKQFLWPGYVELTDESLAKYLRLTTTEPIDARKLTAQRLMSELPRIPLDDQRSEILAQVDQTRLHERMQTAQASTPLRTRNPFMRLFRK